ncbi:hypothetical protein Tco_0270421 [Tanacetum coccineum]
MASLSELWIREYNEASKHAYDSTRMISKRSSFGTGPEAHRHWLKKNVYKCKFETNCYKQKCFFKKHLRLELLNNIQRFVEVLSNKLLLLVTYKTMAGATQMTVAGVYLPSFEGLRPSTVKVSSLSFRMGGGFTRRGLVVKAATSVAPKVVFINSIHI